jgi:hypothetical protein
MRCIINNAISHVNQSAQSFYNYPPKQKLIVICKTFLIAVTVGIITGNIISASVIFGITLDFLINHPNFLNFWKAPRPLPVVSPIIPSPLYSPELPETPSFEKKIPQLIENWKRNHELSSTPIPEDRESNANNIAVN